MSPILTVRCGLQSLSSNSGGEPSKVVGTVLATDVDSDRLGNWQIVGGSGVGRFTIDPGTGQVRVTRDHPVRQRHFTLRVVVDDRKLTSRPEVVTIEIH